SPRSAASEIERQWDDARSASRAISSRRTVSRASATPKGDGWIAALFYSGFALILPHDGLILRIGVLGSVIVLKSLSFEAASLHPGGGLFFVSSRRGLRPSAWLALGLPAKTLFIPVFSASVGGGCRRRQSGLGHADLRLTKS